MTRVICCLLIGGTLGAFATASAMLGGPASFVGELGCEIAVSIAARLAVVLAILFGGRRLVGPVCNPSTGRVDQRNAVVLDYVVHHRSWNPESKDTGGSQ